MMKIKTLAKLSSFLLVISFAFTACMPNIFNDGSYDMTIFEISNPQVQAGKTTIDVRVNNRGCPIQSFQRAEVEKSGNSFKLGIRYKDGEGVSTCATFDQVHTVDLGQLSSGDYFVQARGQSQPSLTITIP